MLSKNKSGNWIGRLFFNTIIFLALSLIALKFYNYIFADGAILLNNLSQQDESQSTEHVSHYTSHDISDIYQNLQHSKKYQYSQDGNDGNYNKYDKGEVKLLKKLSARRELIDSREKSLDIKNHILKTGEIKLEQRISELRRINNDLNQKQQKSKINRNREFESFIKLYENMRPKDAARIIESLERETMITIITSMNPTRAAPVLARMSSEKARLISSIMVKRQKTRQR